MMIFFRGARPGVCVLLHCMLRGNDKVLADDRGSQMITSQSGQGTVKLQNQ